MTTADIGAIKAEIQGNLARVREAISSAEANSGRKPGSVTLVAVSKGITPDIASLAAGSGCRVFGENKVQEAQTKIPLMPAGLEWHMIGRLQSNKARECPRLFSLVHSVDRDSLAAALDRHAREAGKPMDILVQVSISGAESQGGVPVTDIHGFIDKISKLDYLRICGLMAIGPHPAGEDELRGGYRRMKGVFDGLAGRLGPGFNTLSMGMSGDYPIAIEEGSTMVRIGTAIFGDRRYK